MVIAILYLLNTILSYIGIDTVILSLLGGMSILPLIFLYLTSYVFKFCAYHRMFLHYIVVCDIINYIDYYYGIPLSDRSLFALNIIIAGVFLFVILYLKFKVCKHLKD
jgi:hypothetical protein